MKSMNVPALHTERLTLRGHTLDDFPALAAMWADPIVTRFVGGTPLSEEEAWAKLLRSVGQWQLMGYGFWSVHERQGGERIGELGFLEGRRDIVPSLVSTPECGWALASRAHGKGYASEALSAALAWGDVHFGKVRTACIISPENAASLRVAEKAGYREAARTTYKGSPTIVFYRDP